MSAMPTVAAVILAPLSAMLWVCEKYADVDDEIKEHCHTLRAKISAKKGQK